MNESQDRRVDLRDYLRVITRRIWLVIVPLAVAGAAAFVLTTERFQTPVYQAQSRLELEFTQQISKQLQGIVSQPTETEQFARIANLMQSTEFLKEVIRSTGMGTDPAARQWAQNRAKKYPSLTEDELVELYLMRYLRSTISGDTQRRDPVFTITVTDYYPRRALEICQAITDGVIDASKKVILDQMKATQDFALEQVTNYKLKLEEAEQQLYEYQSGKYLDAIEGGLVNTANNSQVQGLVRAAQVQVDDLRQRAERLSAELLAMGVDSERWVRMIRPAEIKAGVDHYVDITRELTRSEIQDLAPKSTNSTTTSLSVQMANKRRDLAAAMGAMVREARGGAELSELERQKIVTLLLTDLDQEAARSRSQVLSSELAAYRERAAQIPIMETQARQLQQEAETIRAMFNTFMQQVVNTQVAESFEAQKKGGRLRVLEPAQLPLEPMLGNRLVVLMVACMGGFAVGIILVFMVEHHDNTVRDVSELPEPLRDRVIGSMPLIKERMAKEREYRKGGRKGQAVPVFEYYQDETAAAFEFRRLGLELARAGQMPRSIMVTSAERGEGKTTTAALLALSVARHRGVRTVLVDLDFRKPTMHKQMGLARHTPGAAEALAARSLNREDIQATPDEHLFVLPAGSFRSISAETLSTESVSWLIQELRQWFDVVVIDSPPNLAVPDPLVIGQVVEAVLFVVKAGATSQKVLERGYELQTRSRANVAGVFMNNIRNIMPYYYSYAHYGYSADEVTPNGAGGSATVNGASGPVRPRGKTIGSKKASGDRG